jgi:hypothetical protein
MKNKTLWLVLGGIGVLIIMTKGKTILTSVASGVIDTMAAAIQNFEGWYPGSRSYRNNNPGNLRWSDPDTIPWAGAIGLDDANHVVFESYDSGMAALKRQLSLAFSNQSSVYSTADTLYSFFSKYAEGNQAAYAESVAAALGVDPNSTLANLVGQG